ncbi:hypothetical protein ZWY2020_047495 [Hordeum vulgare]|nr:hypothetical protein ZWY2020_047495 [Hordeum vulgare]
MQGSKLEDMLTPHGQRSTRSVDQHIVPQQDIFLIAGNAIFCDAAWKNEGNAQPCPAGIGIIIQTGSNQHCQQLHVSALSPPASTPLQPEAFGFHLVSVLAKALHLHEPCFYTDSYFLASGAKTTSIFKDAGYWSIRPTLVTIQASQTFHSSMITQVDRHFNVKAHHQAKLALKIQYRSLAIRRLSSDTGLCVGRNVIFHVKCESIHAPLCKMLLME